MLDIRALHVTDFGPFKGHQTVRLTTEDGVTIVYGENMRGKTSLLNAIRFAFFGRVLGRGMKSTSLHKVGNWEQAALGKFGFEVQLEFVYDGRPYSLTRSFRPRPGVGAPSSDADYRLEHFLARDGVVLGPQQGEAELKRILPEQIARFFLFDGELLQEYEDLLSSESDMGLRISEAIERILGVPVLTTARATLLRLSDKSKEREALAAQGDQKTREFGNQLADLHEQKRVLVEDLGQQEVKLEARRSAKAGLEDAMRKKERLAALLDKRDTLERQIKEVEARHVTKRADLSLAMSTAWCTLIRPSITALRDGLAAREARLQTSLLRDDVLRVLRADSTSECPACMQPISEEARHRIEAAAHHHEPDSGPDRERELAQVRRQMEAARRYAEAGRSDALRLRWQGVEQDRMDLATKRGEVDEIAKQLESVDEDELRQTRSDYEGAIREIDAIERAIAKARGLLETNKVDAARIQARLDKLAGSNLAGERKRRELYGSMHKLFDEAVSAYRDQLRRQVEADATRHFKLLTTEPDYAGLRINASYGLTIMHRDGNEIPVRSAGAEHVVALCLMGALQNNAPLRGPIIIDSPFGRLDRGHKRNIVRALPSMARQVVLLVYEDELPPDIAREELKGSLRAEWRLQRESARHTILTPRRD